MFLSEVLSETKRLLPGNKPVRFTIEIRTFNRYNKTGGKYIVYHNAERLRPPVKKGVKRLADPTPFKNPNHFKNRTINIKVGREIVKVNIMCIIRFNGFLVQL